MSDVSFYKIPVYIKNIPTRIRQIGIGRYLYTIFNLLGIGSEFSRNIIRILKVFLKPLSYYKSLNYKPYIKFTKNISIPEDTKSLYIPKKDLSGADELIKHCRNIYIKNRKKVVKNFKQPYYTLIDNNAEDMEPSKEKIFNLKPILKFASQNLLIGVVSQHYKQIPIIAGISLNYTGAMKASEKPINAQRFHRDLHDKKLLHLVIPIYEIKDEHGPFTYIDTKTSKKIVDFLGHKGGRIDDDDVHRFAKKKNIIKLTGKAGSAFFMNPYYSIHFGGRVKKGFRLQLIISYAPPNLAIENVGFLNRRGYQKSLVDEYSTIQEKKLLNIY